MTASHSSQYDMLAIISSRYQYRPLLFFVAEVVKLPDYWRAEKIFSTSGGLPEACGICHMCHMVNLALLDTVPRTNT